MSKIVIVTKKGMIIQFDSENLPTQTRNGLGVRGMKIRDNDEIASAFSVRD